MQQPQNTCNCGVLPQKQIQTAHHVDGDLEDGHGQGGAERVAGAVVRRVDDDLVGNFVEARREGDEPVIHLQAVVHPHGELLLLHAANVRVRARQDVLQLRHLLVDILDGLGFGRGLGHIDRVAGRQRGARCGSCSLALRLAGLHGHRCSLSTIRKLCHPTGTRT